MPTELDDWFKALEHEKRELRQANEILGKVSNTWRVMLDDLLKNEGLLVRGRP